MRFFFLIMLLLTLLPLSFSVASLAQDVVPADEKSSPAVSTEARTAQDQGGEQSQDELERKQEELLRANAALIRFQIGQADGDWLSLLELHIPELYSSAEPQSLSPGVLKRLRTNIASILSTEGYFSPVIQFEKQAETASVIRVNIDAGLRSSIAAVNLTFSGDLADAARAGQPLATGLRDRLTTSWSLPVGSAFQDGRWVRAKAQLVENLRAETYASGRISDSSATVDADQHSAVLALDIVSGPPFTLGEIGVSGLERYPPWLLDRFNPPKKGELYSRARLLEYQRVLQNSAYFSTVSVGIDPDPAKADAVPVEVAVVERRARDLGIGVGYSTNTGLRTELTYRDRNFFDKAWDLRSAVRIEQKRQLAYADIYLPPREIDQLDSFGVLSDYTDLAGLVTNRSAIGIKRTSTRERLEQRLGLNLSNEQSQLDGEAKQSSKALVASIGWTWRDVDDNFFPRKGQIAQFDLAVSEKTLISDQRFIRAYSKYQRWIPSGQRDYFILRAEAGQVFSASAEGIPENYLFRTGGSSTVRGYPYQSLGVPHPGGVTGGRVMAAASAEYVHWFDRTWGSAVFVDAGDAAESWRDFRIKQSYGAGARYRTPAGPIALDLAYGNQTKKFALDFSIAIAF